MHRLKHTIKQSSRLLNSIGYMHHHRLPYSQGLMVQQQIRTMAMFKSREAQLQNQKVQKKVSFAQAQQKNKAEEPQAAQIRSQEDIIKSINAFKTSIREKSKSGMSLSEAIAQNVDQDQFVKIQRYEIFINKMSQLYKSEMRFMRKQNLKFQEQTNAILYSLTPLKDVFRSYNDLTVRGFNSKATVQTLQNILNVMRARGYQARVHNDYSQAELEQSWKMQKLVDDIKFGLRPDQFFNPRHLGQTSLKIGELKYKNTDLITHFFDKLKAMGQELESGISLEQTSLDYKDAVYGDFLNFLPRHYIFKGFQNSEEFKEYLQILLEWETSEDKISRVSEESLGQQYDQLQSTFQNVINAALAVKDLQSDYQASIESLRSQYFKMMQASDKHQFLKENPYIKYDLLELQEMLVKGGYVDPDEATKSILANEPFEQRMNRAAEVFYDYVQNYAPELLSPQHEGFHEAASQSVPIKDPLPKQFIEERNNTLNVGAFSDTIVGLAQQALSFRRDVEDKDYLNSFYEKFLMPIENSKEKENFPELEKWKHETVMMERCYLKGWKIFMERTQELLPLFERLVKQECTSKQPHGLLKALHAMGAMRLDAPELRSQAVKQCLAAYSSKQQSIPNQSILSGLMGLALSPTQDANTERLAEILSSKLSSQGLSFPQMLDALWSLCATRQYDCQALQNIVATLNSFNFERIDHDIQYDEYMKLVDIHNALKFESPGKNQITNKGLLVGIESQEISLGLKFVEPQTRFDPLKARVVGALAKGFTSASIESQAILEHEMRETQTLDTEFLNKEKYPYKPDVIMGYKGSKVGVFVLPEMCTTRDTYQALGDEAFRMRVLKSANQSISTVAVPVNQVVNYDIERLHIDMNQQFNIKNLLDSQLKSQQAAKGSFPEPDLSDLAEFGAKFMQGAVSVISQLPLDKDVQKMNAFIQKLYQLFLVNTQNKLRYEAEQKNTGYDDLRFQMMKLSLLHQTLSEQCKGILQANMNEHFRGQTFDQLLKKVFDTIPEPVVIPEKEEVRNLNSNWIGTRLEVELPVSQEVAKQAKSLEPEIINQRFMWVDDYFHYSDWKEKQKQTFDNFNLIVVPLSKDAPKYFYDKDFHHRRIPQGIFPYPNHKRHVMQPSFNYAAHDLTRSPLNDELTLFQKEPYKYMVLKELKKTETLSPIDDETSMITNLQNVKQGLKSDYSDKEILNIILVNLNFTEQLIQEHLSQAVEGKQAKKPSNETKFVGRDAKEFRRFVASTYNSKDREDPFTHFYLKEGAKKEKIHRLLEEDKQAIVERENTNNTEVLEREESKRAKLSEKVEDMLLQIEHENEDMMNLSTSLRTNVNVKYDMRTLIKSEYVYDVDPDLEDMSLTDTDYLFTFRRRAEAKLIKTKIIYKVQKGLELTKNEKEYCKKWIQSIRYNDNCNLLNLRDTLLPQKPSRLTIGDIDAKNLYTLNSISRVQLERDRHGKFALNDLVVELSHFLDEEVVNKIETEVFSEKLKDDWKLGKDFKVVETRNKEISIVLNELEELVWRTAGMITENEFEYLKRMVSIKRNKDYFDKQFYENDMRSFKAFLDAANYYDDRVALLERWLERKEEEIKSRVNMPPAQLKKTDEELFAVIDAPLKKAREALVSKFLVADEHGNPIKKEYKDLTSRELHILTENLALRLYLFNYDYPTFMPQVIKGVMEHPNLLRSDKDHLDTYCKMFELDWRGDRHLLNRQEFLSSHPIYLDGANIKSYADALSQDNLKVKLQKACVPYVEETTQKLLSAANQLI